MSTTIDLRELPGLVATVVTSGHVEDSFSQCLSNMRSWCDRNDFHRVEWKMFKNPFVEAGRDEVIRHALSESYAWCLQIDADAAPFAPDALKALLETAFITHPTADVVGAYAQLKHPPYLPTIDTGTGTWEVHFPNEGVLPVIRTGAHFLLVKPEVCRRFGPPWFRTRNTMRPVDAIRELDNYARIKLDGANPFAEDEAWERLVHEAKGEAGGVTSGVGEDSGFCDSVKAVGGTILVNTDVWVGHVAKRVITPDLLDDEMKKTETLKKAAVGIYE